MSSIQERIDDAFQVWGRAAPPMRADEGDAHYIRRIAQMAKKKNYLATTSPPADRVQRRPRRVPRQIHLDADRRHQAQRPPQRHRALRHRAGGVHPR